MIGNLCINEKEDIRMHFIENNIVGEIMRIAKTVDNCNYEFCDYFTWLISIIVQPISQCSNFHTKVIKKHVIL